MHPHDGSHEQDAELVRSVRSGSLPAWHAFVTRYTGLLYAVISRYIPDREEARTVYAQVLVDLHAGKLYTYEGRSALSTWLVPVARSIAIDHIRRQHGRRLIPREIRKLGESAIRVYHLYFLEGLSLDAVCHRLSLSSPPVDREEILDCLRNIESRLGRRSLRALEYRAHAVSIGETSARLLEFLDHIKVDLESQAARSSPDFQLLETEARGTIERVLALVSELPPEERRVMAMRFDRGWTAKQISEALNMGGQRRVYTILEQALRRLRRWAGLEPTLSGKPEPPPGA